MASNSLPHGTVFYSGHGQAGNWSDPANWTGGIVPSVTSGVALFTTDATLNSSFSTDKMMMLGTESITVNGTLNTTSTNLCSSFMICNGAHVLFTASSAMNDAGGLIVGVHAHGWLTVQGDGAQRPVVNSRDLKVGQHQGSDGSLTVSDAVWHTSDSMFVGLTGIGAMTVDNSQMTVGACFGIGVNKGGVGSVTLSDNSSLSVGSFAVIGGNGLDSDTPPPPARAR